MPITAFDVAIGSQEAWFPVEIVPIDRSRRLHDPLPIDGKEYRYWRMSVTENGVTEEVDGRLLIAGPSALAVAAGSVIVQEGNHVTWGRLVTASEVIIDRAQGLVVN